MANQRVITDVALFSKQFGHPCLNLGRFSFLVSDLPVCELCFIFTL